MKKLLASISLMTLLASPVHAEITIGVAGPMTGGLAAFGEQIQHGAQLAVEEANRQGGLLGQKIALQVQDDACDPKLARMASNKLAAEKVSMVLGHWCSNASMAASGVYGEEGILQIDVGGLLGAFTHQGIEGLFRVSTNAKTYAQAVGGYAAAHNPGATIAIVTDQPAVTKEFAKELEMFFASSPTKVVAMEDIQGGQKDFSTLIDRLKAAKPDVVICSCYTIEAGLLARQMIEKKLDVYYYGWDTLNSPDFLRIVGAENTGKIVSIDYARAPQSAALSALAAELRARNWPVETTTILTYAAFQIFTAAAKEAGSAESAKIAKAMHGKSFDTVLGVVKFDESGDRVAPAFAAYQWKNGKLLAVAESLTR